jgi:hypothetical protein
MARDPFSCKYPLKLKHLNMCEYIPLMAFAGGSSGNDHQLLTTSRVTATGTTADTSTNTATAIDTAPDSETATATAT